MIKIESLD